MRYLIFSTALVLISLAQTTFADVHSTISIPVESLSVKGEVTNLELTDTGGVISVKAIAGKYGLVFLTYNMSTNPNSKTQKLKAPSLAEAWG